MVHCTAWLTQTHIVAPPVESVTNSPPLRFLRSSLMVVCCSKSLATLQWLKFIWLNLLQPLPRFWLFTTSDNMSVTSCLFFLCIIGALFSNMPFSHIFCIDRIDQCRYCIPWGSVQTWGTWSTFLIKSALSDDRHPIRFELFDWQEVLRCTTISRNMAVWLLLYAFYKLTTDSTASSSNLKSSFKPVEFSPLLLALHRDPHTVYRPHVSGAVTVVEFR